MKSYVSSTQVASSTPFDNTTAGAKDMASTDVQGALEELNPKATRNLYVDGNRTDTYTADGTLTRPFKTITAALNQIVTNADNATHIYTILVYPAAYAETLTFNNALFYNIIISSLTTSAATPQNLTVTGLTSTSNNTQLATLVFNNITFNGSINLTGNVNGTNFASSQVLFSSCQFNNSAGTFVLNNINNVNMYDCQIQGGSSVATFTNVAFAYLQGVEGFISGTTIHLVDNPGGNVPSQYSGNYFLLSETKCYATVTIDAGSELDSLLSYFGSGSSITNNGIIHSWNTNWNGSLTLNSGSITRFQGDILLNSPTVNAGATVANRGATYLATAQLGASAAAAPNTVLVVKDGHIKSTQTTAPTTTLNGNAGTGGSPATSVSHATDNAGILSLTTGTGSWAAGVQTTVNFNKAFNVAPIVVLYPANNNAATGAVSRGVYVTSTVNGFSVNFTNPDTAQTTYTWNYQVLETQ